jgi:hypothetical protein
MVQMKGMDGSKEMKHKKGSKPDCTAQKSIAASGTAEDVRAQIATIRTCGGLEAEDAV